MNNSLDTGLNQQNASLGLVANDSTLKSPPIDPNSGIISAQPEAKYDMIEDQLAHSPETVKNLDIPVSHSPKQKVNVIIEDHVPKSGNIFTPD